MWGAHDGMGWWMAFGAGIWLVAITAFIYFAALLPARTARGSHGRRETALEVARRRYAAGEISEDEFLRLKRTLDR